MVRALLRRAFTGLAVVLGVVTLMFFLIRLAPGDPALLLVGPTASEEQLAAQRRSLGLDQPLVLQEADLADREVGELDLQVRQDVPDRERGGGVPARRTHRRHAEAPGAPAPLRTAAVRYTRRNLPICTSSPPDSGAASMRSRLTYVPLSEPTSCTV